MALTAQQIAGLDIASQRKIGGTASATDIVNLDYASKQGYVYKPPVAPTPPTTPYVGSDSSKWGINQPITPGALVPEKPLDLPKEEPSYNAAGEAVAGVDAYSKQLLADKQAADLAVAEQDKKRNEVSDTMISLLGNLENKGADILAAETTAGIPGVKSQLSDVNGQIGIKMAEYNKLEKDYQQLSTSVEGHGMNLSNVLSQQGAIERQRLATLNSKAADISLLQAQGLALQGKLKDAQDMVDRSINLKYSVYEAKIKTYEAQLNAIKDSLTGKEKVQAEAQRAILEDQKQKLADAKAEDAKKTISATSKATMIAGLMGTGLSVTEATKQVNAIIALSGGNITFDTPAPDPSSTSSNPESRTDRNNNPTAMTTDVAKNLGLKFGVDYTQGDSFKDANGNTLYTAKLTGDSLTTTIKGLDAAANNPNTQAFYTSSGTQRWTHTAMTDAEWLSMTPTQKINTVKQMYNRENGPGGSLYKENQNNNPVNSPVNNTKYSQQVVTAGNSNAPLSEIDTKIRENVRSYRAENNITEPSTTKTTDAQNTTATYVMRLSEANKIISGFESNNPKAGVGGFFQSLLPDWGISNFLKTSDFQSMEQAERDFVNAVLRKESGAAISPSEFDNAKKQYFPQPGDSAATIEQKRRNRLTTITGMTNAAGPALNNSTADNDPLGIR